MAVKKLIEVALPLDAINAASAREKSIRHGHPSTLHLWWARRPLAAARAVIWASLVDDPSSHPEQFPTENEQNAERRRLFSILEELVIWENSTNQTVLSKARNEIRKSMGDKTLTLLDPFAGGGAIPLEAQRLGLQALAQDLNPVAVAINKAMIEIPQRFAGRPAVNPEAQRRKSIDTWDANTGLAADVEYYGKWMMEEAYRRIGHLYPEVDIPDKQGGGKTPVIAYIWARTIKCPNPACGCIMPLIKTYDLSKKRGKLWHVEPHFNASTKGFSYSIEPGRSPIDGTINRQGAHCPHCNAPISFQYIRDEGASDAFGLDLIAVVGAGNRDRLYLAPDDKQRTAASVVRPDDSPTGELLGKARVNVGLYGFADFSDLFTNRQLTALSEFSNLIPKAQALATKDAVEAGLPDDDIRLDDGGCGARAYGEAVGVYLAFALDRLANRASSICIWNRVQPKIEQTFGRQAIPMTWDFAESNPFSGQTGSWMGSLGWIPKAIMEFPSDTLTGKAIQKDAQSGSEHTGLIVSTDPPYYDNIDYADLSDFFYIWMRKSLKDTYPNLFNTMLVPKAEELVATPYRFKGGAQEARDFFEEGMYRAFEKVNKCSREDVPITIYYAFKQSDTETINNVESTASTGWETMLSAIIKAGFSINGTWPIRTERSTGLKASFNALASSIVLVCRKRSEDAPMVTRREFVNTLKRELKPALDKLQTSNIAPVDLAQSAIGPGIGVFSRYEKVLEADGSEMSVRSALQVINQELDLYFSDQDSDLDRESRFCVDLYTQSAFNEIRFGEADVLARAKNTSIEGIAAKGALSSTKGVVRLLGRDEIRDMPAPDFCWLFTQQLTHAMESGGIEACAKMLKDIYDGRADNARALAYRLFTIADKKKWNQEAFAYNSLVTAWRDIESRAAQLQRETPVQTTLDI